VSPRAPAAVGAVLLVLAVLMAAERSADWRQAVPRAAPPTSARSGDAPVVAPFAPRASAAAAAAPALQAGEIEICGIGRAMRGTADADELEQQARDRWDDATTRLLQRMHNSPDARTRAAALMARRDAASLVEVALRSNDAAIYAMALQTCAASYFADQRGHACEMLDVAQLARLEPDNLVSWMYMAAAAARRGEHDNLVQALHRASQARYSQMHVDRFTTLAMSAWGSDTPAAERLLPLVSSIGIQASFSHPPYGALSRACDEAAVKDVNRRQTCEAIAQVMVTQGRSLSDAHFGRRIGERAGWSADRVDLIGAKVEAAMGAMANEHLADEAAGGAMRCELVPRYEAWHRDVAEHGDWGAAQRRLGAALPSDAALLERYREAKQRRAAAAAASAPER
jgi:hypothetical protein